MVDPAFNPKPLAAAPTAEANEAVLSLHSQRIRSDSREKKHRVPVRVHSKIFQPTINVIHMIHMIHITLKLQPLFHLTRSQKSTCMWNLVHWTSAADLGKRNHHG